MTTLIEKDLSQTSIDLLGARCRIALSERLGSRAFWFPDDRELYPARHDGEEPLEVVLFGSFLKRFFESGCWPDRPIRLWVLCEAAKRVMTQLLGVPGNLIGVIPRYALFPVQAKPCAIPRADEPFTLVFGGRLSPAKNIEMLLWTTHWLQKLGIPARLALYGDFDDQWPLERGYPRPRGSYRERILELRDRLEWTQAPQFTKKLEPEEWIQQRNTRPLFISLSTFLCEDYGVSLAQAQAAGWPFIVTDWGGHSDARAENGLKIHPMAIGHCDEPESVISLKAKNLAIHLQKSFFGRTFLRTADSSTPLVPPDRSDVREFDRLRRKMIERLGPGIQILLRGGIEAFAKSEAGASFLSQYRLQFTGQARRDPVVILINDLHEPAAKAGRDPQLERIAEITESAIQHYGARGDEVLLLPVREFKSADSMWVIARASRIMIPFYSRHLLPMLQAWMRRFDLGASIHLFVDPKAKAPGLDELQSWLRPRDRISDFSEHPHG